MRIGKRRRCADGRRWGGRDRALEQGVIDRDVGSGGFRVVEGRAADGRFLEDGLRTKDVSAQRREQDIDRSAG